MQKQRSTWHYLAGLVLLASFGQGVRPGLGADKKDALKPLRPEIVKAWCDAGADVGWMKDVPPKYSNWGTGFWEPFIEKAEPGAVPAFRYHPNEVGMLAKLPDPGLPFGLDTHCSSMKELAGLKSLQSLKLGCDLA